MVKVSGDDLEAVIREFEQECSEIKKYNPESTVGVPEDEYDYKYFLAVMYCVALYRKRGCTLSVTTIRDRLPISLDDLTPDNFEPMNYDLAVTDVIYEHRVNNDLVELYSKPIAGSPTIHLQTVVDKIFNKCVNDGYMPFNSKEEAIMGLVVMSMNLMMPGKNGPEKVSPIKRLIHTVRKPDKYFTMPIELISEIVMEALGERD